MLKLEDRFTNLSTLKQLAEQWQNRSLKSEFDADNSRASRFSVNAAGIFLDYSKNHLDQETISELVKLCSEANLPQSIRALLRGDSVNNTENRPALHSALRQLNATSDQQQEAAEARERMFSLINRVYDAKWLGFRGDKITDVVNIGIGGSDLGPRMVVKALSPYLTPHLSVHFVANIDGAEISDLLKQLNPATTLFIVASKSFSTLETLQNALSARSWMLENACPENELHKHFVAISSKIDKAIDFGIAEENVFPIWDWVGGRYSLWSNIGMSIAFAVGPKHFEALLKGASDMDEHFSTADLDKNIPVLMAIIVFWYSNIWGSDNQAILPYSNHLQLLPSYLQQLEMESNGKSVSKEGERLGYQTGSVIWGTEGTNGQHSFHQLLHQGQVLTPIDFIATLKAHHDLDHQHKYLFANCVAQSQALMAGRSLSETKAEMLSQGVHEDEAASLAEHKVHPGNNPSNMIILEQLTPETLGALIAAYEHKVFVLSVLWGINAFDQWGVELGKLLGTQIAAAIDTTDVPQDWDSSTQNLIKRFIEKNPKD
jgi:glucose-6-phosphate isomerase